MVYRYDNHREQILRGSHTDYEDESLDVFLYFTASCYKGFSDDPTGFYAVYAKVFDRIAAEDIEFKDSPNEYEQIPKFGASTSDYKTVVGPFYAYWQSYCTKKSYSWLCPHNISEIRDRRILREVEKETKKIAQKKRKERNDEVRALVSFVRKRDKRVQEHRKILEAKAEQNRYKQQQHRLTQLRKNQQEAQEMLNSQMSLLSTDHEEQLRQMEQAYGTDNDDEDDENEDGVSSENEDNNDFIDDLYCVACNKTFKNICSFENHGFSKRHRENTELLREYMHKEDKEHVEEHQNMAPEHENIDNESPAGEVASKKMANKRAKKLKKLKTQCINDTENELEDIIDDVGNLLDVDKDDWNEEGTKKKKKFKNKRESKKSIHKKIPSLDESETQSYMKKSNKSNESNHKCVTCSTIFESKNKLFAHLKKTNHGVFIPKTDEKINRKK